jgi:phage shock protein A
LTRAVKTIIAEDSGVPLRRRIVELEEDKNTLQHACPALLVMGNRSLLSERNELKSHCEDLQAALVEARSDAKKRVANLEAKVTSAEAHSEKRLRDFEDGLVRKLEELHGLYVGNVQTIGGFCSQLPIDIWSP